MSTLNLHATAVAFPSQGGARAVLLRGPSGCGKSDLALRLLEAGATLVADDRVLLARRGAQLFVSPPVTIRGRMEVRGLGILAVPALDEARLHLVVDLVAPGDVPRLPPERREEFLSVACPLIALAPFEASAAAKVKLALQAISGPLSEGVTFPFALQ